MKLVKNVPLLLALMFPALASATILVSGQWKAEFYTAKGDLMFDAGVCFQGDNTWHMTTQSYSAGKWNLVGNNIRIHGGNFNSNGAGELVRVTPKFMAGPWQSWTDDDVVNMDLVSRWSFVKKVCDPAAPVEE